MRAFPFAVLTYALALLAVLTWVGRAGTAQEPTSDASNAGQPTPLVTFRADANFVEVHAVVTDERGVFVQDLTQEDFEIYEEGEAKTPSAFALVDLPVAPRFTPAHQTDPVESDVRATTGRFEGRLYLLVLDDLHTLFARTVQVRDAARRFVERHMGADDLAAVVHTSGRVDGAQELTSSRRRLLAAIDQFQGRKLPSAGLERLAMHLTEVAQPRDDRDFDDPAAAGVDTRSADGLSDARLVRDASDAERGNNARRALTTVRDAAKRMADVHGRRKALLFFSEGIDYDIYEPFNRSWASAILNFAQDAVAAAQRSNVSVYGVDPRGLNQFGTETIGVQSLSLYPQLQYGSVLGFARELRLAQESLISLADQTGGMAVINTNDLDGALRRIAADSTRYYLLGYHSDPQDWSADTFRKLEVRVKRPGLRVRARRGFVTPPPEAPADGEREPEGQPDTSPTLRVALSTLVPMGEVPIRVFAAPFTGAREDSSVLVVVEVGGRGFRFEERDGRFHENVELSIAAVDHRGNVRGGENQTLNLNFSPETHEWVSRTGVRLLARLDLPAGRYQIRVGVHETVGGTTGTVAYDLDVPDHSKIPFALSGLVLTSSYAASYATNAPDPQLQDLLPGPPTANRRFTPEETLTSFAEVYDRSSATAHAIDFDATVWRGSDGRAVFSSRDRRTVEASDEPHTHGFATELPLADFSPGMYVLRVMATSSVGDYSVFREVPFEVAGGFVSQH